MLYIIIKIILFQALLIHSMPKAVTANGVLIHSMQNAVTANGNVDGDVDTSMPNPNEVPANGVNDIDSPYKGKSLFTDSGSEIEIAIETNTCPEDEMADRKSPPELMAQSDRKLTPKLMAQSNTPAKQPHTTNSVPPAMVVITTNPPISSVSKKVVPKKTRARLAMIKQGNSAGSNLFIRPSSIIENKNLFTNIILDGRISAIPRKDQTDFIVQWAHLNKLPVGFNFANLRTHISKFDLAAVILLKTARRLHDDTHPTEQPKKTPRTAKKRRERNSTHLSLIPVRLQGKAWQQLERHL